MRCNKTVSFNLSDPDDLALYNHATKINPLTNKAQNFSKYVKRLIDNDINHNKGVFVHHVPSEANPIIEDVVKVSMGSFF